MSNKKTVLQFCHGYKLPFADITRQYKELFNPEQYNIVTVFLTGKRSPDIETMLDGKVVFLENSSSSVRGMKLRQIRQIRTLHEKYQFDFAITHRFKPLYIASYIKALPIIGVHHGYGDFDRLSHRWHVYRHKRNIRLLGVSNAIRDDIRQALPRMPKEHIQTLYNRVDTVSAREKLLSKKEAREKLDLPESAFVFGNVGRLHPDKDQSTLIKAFAKIRSSIPNGLLVIIGEGRLREKLEQEASNLGVRDHVRFTGKVPEAATLFRAFDCFVLSSDHEPFGMVLLEAMIAGVPVIASNCGGAPEVTGDTGWLFTLGDENQLADKMRAIKRLSSTKQKEIASAMLDRVNNHFSYDAVSMQFWKLPFVRDMAGKSESV